MSIINLSNKEYHQLEPYNLPNNVISTEGKFYLFPLNNQIYLLKKFFITEGSTFTNKIYTLNSLIDNKELIALEELIFPQNIISLENNPIGYTMPLVESINLKDFLASKSSPIKNKITYLKQIGSILEKMHQIRTTTSLKDFYLNDLHEQNLIISKKDHQLKVVDLDSCKINNNQTSPSKYLQISSLNPQYRNCLNPSLDTELYCYNIIILNYLSDTNIYRLTPQEYYNYLNYLLDIGMNKELIDKLSHMTTNNQENVSYLLDSIIPFIEKSSYKTYKLKK